MRIRSALAWVAATPLVLWGAAPAAADSASDVEADAEAKAAFTMTMTSGDHYGPSPGGPGEGTREVTLTCYPVGGTHPAPEEACEILTVVEGDFEALPLNPGFCIQVWDPVSVTVKGHWLGERVEFQKTYSNSACAAAGSDGIFAF